MAHVTELIGDPVQATDESITIIIRCCGDKKTDSACNMILSKVDENGQHVMTPPEEINQRVEEHHDRVRLKHEHMLAGQEHVKTIVKRKKVHAPVTHSDSV